MSRMVFINISHGSDDPHRLLMALNMAKTMADDHNVLVYLDIKGADAILKNFPDITYSHFPSFRTRLSELLQQGGDIDGLFWVPQSGGEIQS